MCVCVFVEVWMSIHYIFTIWSNKYICLYVLFTDKIEKGSGLGFVCGSCCLFLYGKSICFYFVRFPCKSVFLHLV